MNEKLEKLNQQIAQGEAKLRRAQHEEKILAHQIKQLTRKERTHRLCTRGAMLESFLIRPEVLTDDDVMDILKQAFSQTGMKETVAESVKGRVKRMISSTPAAASNHHRDATLSLHWLRQLPLCGLVAREHLTLQAVPAQQVYNSSILSNSELWYNESNTKLLSRVGGVSFGNERFF